QERLLVVSYQRHFYPAYAYARELVQKGALGELKGVVAYVTQNWGGRGWRMVPELAGGGMFMDTGSHLVAAVLWITGLTPVKVSAFMDKRGKRVDMDAVVNARFRGGALGSLSFVGSASRHDERLSIHGDKGTLVFHLHQWEVREVLLNGEPLEVPKRVKEDTPDAAFLRWIRNGGKGYERADFAVAVAKFTEAAYRSVEQKRR
ncbi:MAG: Gfo/Idh/MocA family oxidoreductase, partial [Gemmatimonadetes bacterium]|nr:Gfo/Idh/MocA family oxidoreductase [Gemmatimonadota bacterium]